jgi:acyl carrier protein
MAIEPIPADKALIREDLLALIAEEGLIHRERLTPDATLESLGMASYDMVMILMAIEERYGVYISVDTQLSEVKTLEQLLDLLTVRIEAGPTPPPELPKITAP